MYVYIIYTLHMIYMYYLYVYIHMCINIYLYISMYMIYMYIYMPWQKHTDSLARNPATTRRIPQPRAVPNGTAPDSRTTAPQ